MIFIVKHSVIQNVWLWPSAILHTQNTVKTKAYKNDKANQGEGIRNILPSSAFFLFLRWPCGQTSLTVASNLFSLSPISQYHKDKPAVLQGHTYYSRTCRSSTLLLCLHFLLSLLLLYLSSITSCPAVCKLVEVWLLSLMYPNCMLLLGWPNSSVGFFSITSYRKAWMKFLANPLVCTC